MSKDKFCFILAPKEELENIARMLLDIKTDYQFVLFPQEAHFLSKKEVWNMLRGLEEE